ncbi:MAG: hypothetical protein GQ574_06975 [Crocinitomix sp.]|nr:hypothetical protein [Crocinitomix sp.]
MKLVTSLFLLSILTFMSCAKDKTEPYEEAVPADIVIEGGGEYKLSSYGDMESHNMGLACASCHYSGGTGEGWFTIASTVYDESLVTTYPNTTVKLFTGPSGTGDLKYTFEVDGRGNFYSSSTINLQSGLYPAVEGDLTTQYMNSPIVTGNCTSCHGNTTSEIWTK